MIFILEKKDRIYIFSIVFAYTLSIFYSVFNAFTLDVNMVDLLIYFNFFSSIASMRTSLITHYINTCSHQFSSFTF